MRMILVLAALLALPCPARAAEPIYAKRWFYAATNLQVKENADRLIEQIGLAARAGYNGVVLADYKLNVLNRVPDYYFTNLARVQRAATAAKVEIIPTVFPIGYSNGLLTHDPNLAEGMPVQDTHFVVRGKEAVHDPRPKVALANGGMEETKGDVIRGFGFQDAPGKATFADHKVYHHGNTSCRLDPSDRSAANKRLIQQLDVRPHAAYRLSAWIKTDGLTNLGAFRLLAIGAKEPGRSLSFHEGGIAPTQDWQRVEVVFNSLEYNAVNVYAGYWGEGKGKLWIDDLTTEELGLVNVLRRPGCPFTVRSDDGKTTYEEGRDFEPVADPKLGNVPYAGEFEFGHEPATIRITARSRLHDGQRLKVSWFHPVLTHGSQIMCCPAGRRRMSCCETRQDE